ncbi:hypothetical protein ACJIZ3_020943 [Penstemon smallii]|uniref:Disease resistance N-terminal domain-containing protein n=1 Tax=Penstemon smallii TaxID=265156 RepID=A0ABD3SK18_9LAMI
MKQQLLIAVKFFTLTAAYIFTRGRTQTIKYKKREKSIPDVAVLIVLQNLKHLILYNANLIRDAKNQIEILENDVRMFKAFLRDLAKTRYKNEALNDLVNQIRDCVCEAEVIVNDFMIEEVENRARNFFGRSFGGPIKMLSLAKDVKSMRVKVKRLYGNCRSVWTTLQGGGTPEGEKTKDKKVSFLRLRNEPDTSIGYAEESEKLEVISMIGEPGPGKITHVPHLAQYGLV